MNHKIIIRIIKVLTYLLHDYEKLVPTAIRAEYNFAIPNLVNRWRWMTIPSQMLYLIEPVL